MTRVLLLGGGPDAERQVSLNSAQSVAAALRSSGRWQVIEHTIEQHLSGDQLAALPGEVIFPILHGPWGEGGPLQDLLEADGRPYVSSGPVAARMAMDKIATKILAAGLGIPTAPSAVLNLADDVCPIGLPAVIKPVHEGSSVGLHICLDHTSWALAIASSRENHARVPNRVLMVERHIRGRELTVGMLDGSPLPIIEIQPAQGVYDYEAKYTREDTRYVINPELPSGVAERIARHSTLLARGLGVRHLARVDYLLDGAGVAWMLEINTLPGFTSHSLLPQAARAVGLTMPDLCTRLIELALRDAPRR
ncbi:MAG: D-alanine--D-alanine ligase [Phycisphaeraceae bacterium]|nr:D-alanine--D-alanine ligase [Phycisphaeraceae bacterium]